MLMLMLMTAYLDLLTVLFDIVLKQEFSWHLKIEDTYLNVTDQ